MKQLRILLVDDNPNDRTLTIHELEKEFDIKVEEIMDANGLERALKKHNFEKRNRIIPD